MPYWRPSNQLPLGVPNPDITLAVLVQHGASRAGLNYTSAVTNAVLLAGLKLENTMVLGTQVYESGDAGLDETIHIWWGYSTDDGIDGQGGERNWKWGGNSTDELPASISSFQVLDEILLTLANKDLYPNLQRAVFSGNSAGGQLMQRYALFSRVGPEVSGLPLKYVVANPSSMTYLGPERPIQASTKTCENFCDNATIASQVWDFIIPSNSSCVDTYNEYGYGLEGLMADYPKNTPTSVALDQFAARDVIYLSGESDVCDAPFMTTNGCVSCTVEDGGLDTSCEAYAQGWCRMARMHAFLQYVRLFYDNPSLHSLQSVPHVGHCLCGIFQNEEFYDSALRG